MMKDTHQKRKEKKKEKTKQHHQKPQDYLFA